MIQYNLNKMNDVNEQPQTNAAPTRLKYKSLKQVGPHTDGGVVIDDPFHLSTYVTTSSLPPPSSMAI